MDVRVSESLSSWFSSSGSGQYLLEPYHSAAFTQEHTNVTQSLQLTAFNWIIMNVFSVIIFLLCIITNRLSATALFWILPVLGALCVLFKCSRKKEIG